MAVWFITGASRGFGAALTAAALAEGDQVVATARSPQTVLDALPDAGAGLLVVPLDVTHPQQAPEAVGSAVARFGQIDVLVNNAGYGLFGAVEEISDDEARAIFDTNVFGMLTVTRAVLPVLRAQRSGVVLNMSSSAGFASSAGRGLYSATKFALEGITEALRAELAPFGIRVTAVEPGSFRTSFLSDDSRRGPRQRIADYDDTSGRLLTAIESADGRQPGGVDQAVAAIRFLATLQALPVRMQLGSDSVELVENKLRAVGEELAEWRELAVSADLQPATR